jgi:segregation and condensation protein B
MEVSISTEELILHVEALIFASDKALTAFEITTLLAEMHPEAGIDGDKILGAIEALLEKYNTDFYSFGIREIGGGYQFLTKTIYHSTVGKLNGDKFLKRLSTAALETLAIIAYKQPITKPDIEYIRGVSCDYSIQKLLEKELIFISGRNEDAVGKPLLYSTSKNFMDYLGINSIDDMPRLREVVGEDMVIPTSAEHAVPENTKLAVALDGNLVEIENTQTDDAALNNNDDANTAETNEAETNTPPEE